MRIPTGLQEGRRPEAAARKSRAGAAKSRIEFDAPEAKAPVPAEPAQPMEGKP